MEKFVLQKDKLMRIKKYKTVDLDTYYCSWYEEEKIKSVGESFEKLYKEGDFGCVAF